MKITPLLRHLAILLVISANIGCDQVSKSMVRENLVMHESISVLHDNIVLTNVENSGAFLSMGDSLSPMAKSLVLNLLPSLALAFALFWLLSQSHQMSKVLIISLCSIIGGGIGNLFDRIAYGSVTDFLYLHFGVLRTGIFNLADVSIMVGTFLMLGYFLKQRSIQA